jgi:restriction endonuclease Mrr
MPIPHRNKIRNDLIELLKAKKSLETHKAFKLLATQWKLTHAECAEERSGEELYKNEIRWARHELKIAGVIAPPSISGRGVWKLTDAKFRKPFERADEDIGTSYYEGSIETVKVNAYERNTAARKNVSIIMATHVLRVAWIWKALMVMPEKNQYMFIIWLK